MTDLVLSYAKALYSLSEESGIEDKILYEVKQISESLLENPDFIKLLNSPALSLEERHSVAEEAFGQGDNILVNFIKLLIENKHMHMFYKCAKAYEEQYNITHNIELVTVESATELKENQLKKLSDRLETITGKKVVIKTALRPELLGGVVVKMRDRQYDGSISKKLSELYDDIHNVIV